MAIYFAMHTAFIEIVSHLTCYENLKLTYIELHSVSTQLTNWF